MKFLEQLKENIIIFDGAMGTNLQLQNLNSDDFGGKNYEGCNEFLTISKPGAIEIVHRSFLEAGCDVIETNTFGANGIVLKEYGLEDKCYELNFKSAELARKTAAEFMNKKPRFIAGSIGPSTKLPSLGHISFKEMVTVYETQISGLIEGGVDLLICETCQDMLQAKCVCIAIQNIFVEKRIKIPAVFSFTIEKTGSMLLGTDISAMLTTFEPFDIIDIIGLNCATGPKEMSESIRYLSQNSPKPILVMPNAGIPENVNGRTDYKLTPEEMKKWMLHFVDDLGVNAVGGCCGTTKDHIKILSETFEGKKAVHREHYFLPSVSSTYISCPMRIDPPPILVGEKCNANGSKKFRELLDRNDYESILSTAKDQVKEGAHIIDLCVAYVGRDEVQDMNEVLKRFNLNVTLPIMIDTTEVNVMEEALQLYAGRAIINSVNLEDGEDKISKVLKLCKMYGAAVIALTIDELGMAKDHAKKIEVARRIYDIAINKFHLKPKDLIFDTLTFTLGSGDDELRNAGLESLEAIKTIKKEFPECFTILGVSNISFGLNPKARNVLNSVFLHYADNFGLDMAIVNAIKIQPIYKIDPNILKLCEELIFDRRKFIEE